MKYPQEFSAAARNVVETEAWKAEGDLKGYRFWPAARPQRTHAEMPSGERRWTDDEEDIIEYILRVGLAFGLQACKLGSQGWAPQRIREETNQFLRELTFEAYHKYIVDLASLDQMRFLCAAGDLQPALSEQLNNSDEWRPFEEVLAATERPPAQAIPSSTLPPGGATGNMGLEPQDESRLVAEGATGDFLAELFDQFDQEEQAKIRAAEDSTKEILARGAAAAKDRLRAAGSLDVADWIRQPESDARADAAGVVFVAYVNALWRKTDAARAECIQDFLANVDKLITPVLARYGGEGQDLIDELRWQCLTFASFVHSHLAPADGPSSTGNSEASSQDETARASGRTERSPAAEQSETERGEAGNASDFLISVQPSTILGSSDSWSKRRRRKATDNAVLARRLGRTGHESGRQEDLLKDAREWADALLKEVVPAAQDVFDLKQQIVKQTWDRFVPTHRYHSDFKLGYLEFASALLEEGWPSLEDRAMLAIRDHPGSGIIRAEDQPVSEPGPGGNIQQQKPKARATEKVQPRTVPLAVPAAVVPSNDQTHDEIVAERAARRADVVNPILKKRRWKIGRLVTESGVGKATVYGYMNGTRSWISKENREAICQSLDLELGKLPE